MAELSAPARRRAALRAGVGMALIVGGAVAILWLVFDDRLPSRAMTPAPDGIAIWAIVRVAAGVAIAGGAWLLATAMVHRRRGRRRRASPIS